MSQQSSRSDELPARPKPILLSPPTVGGLERDYLIRAFESGWVAPLGPDVDAFEQDLAAATGASHVVALSSGTAALHLALLLAGVQRGDDVLVQSLTFAATANAVHYTGARPVFVDSDPGSWTVDPALVADHLQAQAKRGRLPSAVVAVDIYGQCADYEALLEVCSPFSVPVIADAAESLGASYKGRPAGGLTDLGILSFNGNKMITTSGGGALTTSSAQWAARAQHLATQARDPAPHYEHTEIGYNYRLSNLLAALGRAQLERLPHFVARRRAIRAVYAQALQQIPGVGLMPEAHYGDSNAWLTVITVDPSVAGTSVEDLRGRLAVAGVESRPLWKPMHLQPVHADNVVLGGEVAAGLFRTGLCLPSAPTLTAQDQDRVVEELLLGLKQAA